MKISVCLTTFNEERSIGELLDSLLRQSRKPDEIVVVDGGSIDQTLCILRHYHKKDARIRFISEKCSRAKGRNLSVDLARNDIIAMTDGGCLAKKNWLKNITEPLKNPEVEIVSGFYDMRGQSPLQKAFSVYMGVQPDNFDHTYLPSTRSIAFRRKTFELIGGFPETLEDTAEDTRFTFNAARLGIKFTRVKNARVEWCMPQSIKEFMTKIYKYAKGDVQSKVWFHPVEGVTPHNIKAVLVLARYMVGIILVISVLAYPRMIFVCLILMFFYVIYAFRKSYMIFNDWKVGLWGIVMQFIADFAVINGFLDGTMSRK